MNDVAAGLPVAALVRMSAVQLVEWGRHAIEQAGSFEEVRELRSRAEALRVFQCSRKASIDAVNAATQLRLLADRRMGEALAALDKAAGGQPYQDRGPTGNTLLLVDGERPATYAELGIGKMEASRSQKLAAVPEEIFRAVTDAYTAVGAPLTTAGILKAAARAVEGRRIVDNYTGEFEWYTPPELIEPARQVLGEIDLDPASSETAQRTVRARAYYTRDHDSLTVPWHGRIWMNPPYAHELIGEFIAKLCAHVTAGEVTAAIMLVDNRTDTRWFHHAAALAQRICFTAGRVKFLRPTGAPGESKYGSCLFYFGPAPDTFSSVFSQFGLVYPEPLNLLQEPG